MHKIDVVELLSFIEYCPEKDIPRNVLIKEIQRIKQSSEDVVEKRNRKITITLVLILAFIGMNLFKLYQAYLNHQPLILYHLHLLDVIVSGTLMIGLILKSRVAALLLFTYFLVSQFIHFDTTGISIVPFIGTMILGFLLFQTILDLFQIHKHSEYKKRSRY